MKTKSTFGIFALTALLLVIINSAFSNAHAQGTVFTYQGRLNSGTSPANGNYDFQFALFNAPDGGTQIGGTLTNTGVAVTNGLFITTLDFGPVFTGQSNWLDISVRSNGTGSYVALSPAQQLTPTPYAIYSENAGGLGTNAVVLGGQIIQSANNTLNNNFFVGNTAGNTSGSGIANTAAGLYTLSANTIGSGNTASGYGALFTNTTGSDNTAYGRAALYSNTSGSNNTAYGRAALYSNTSGSNNTAIGSDALFANTNGDQNTAVGSGALFTDTGGGANTAIGYEALSANSIGAGNTASGDSALFKNTIGGENTADGNNALSANTTGGGNTACGTSALAGNTTGSQNTACGISALVENTTGFANAALGGDALVENTTGASNTACGFGALYENTTGGNNTACGFAALSLNTTGIDNTASGADAMEDNTTGGGNSAFGGNALLGNTSGYNNVAVGLQAIQSGTEIDDVAVGVNSLYKVDNGNQNTAVGTYSFQNLTAGINNIGLGANAGYNLVTGTNNIYIGNQGNSSENNCIRIGAQGTQTNTVIAGIYNAIASSGQGGTPVYIDSNGHLGTTTSSRRFKTDIQPMAGASEAIYRLRPVTFKYKSADPKGAPEFGLIAEEVNEVDPDLVLRDGQGQIYSVRYDSVNVMLLNEFLKEHDQVQSQQTEIQKLQESNQAMENRLANLEKMVQQLANKGTIAQK